MKKFLGSNAGSSVLGIILAISTFVFLERIFNLDSILVDIIAGAIAGGVGFGIAIFIQFKVNSKSEAAEVPTAEDSWEG